MENVSAAYERALEAQRAATRAWKRAAIVAAVAAFWLGLMVGFAVRS